MRKIKAIFFLLCLFIINFSYSAIGQEGTEKTRAKIMHDKVKTAIHAKEYGLVNSRLDSMLLFAKEDKDTLQLATAYASKSSMAGFRGEYESADTLYALAIKWYESIGNYYDVCIMYSQWANNHSRRGQQDTAFEYAYKARSYLSKTDKPRARAVNSNFLSLLYSKQGQLDSTIYYELDFIDHLALTDSAALAKGYGNLAQSFGIIGNYSKQKGFLDKAYQYSLKEGLTSTRAEIFLKYSVYEGRHGNKKKAIEYAHQSLDNYKKSKWSRNYNASYAILASAYLADDDIKTAKIYLDSINYSKKEKSLDVKILYLLTKLEIDVESKNNEELINETENIVSQLNDLDHKRRFYAIASKYYQKRKDYESFYKYNQLRREITEQLSNAENRQIVNNLEAKYETARKDKEIVELTADQKIKDARLANQKIILFLSLFFLALFACLSYFIYRLYKKGENQNQIISKALSDKELLIKEIHHRVKNNLQVVSSLLSLQSEYIENDLALSAINEGRNRVKSIALIHQDLYQHDNLTDINVSDYFSKLVKGLFDTYNIQSDRIKLNLDVQDTLVDVETILPLGLITNELVSNALKYAYKETEKGILDISLKKKNDGYFLLEVKDNGKGFDPSIIDENIKSFGYQMILAFVERLEAKMDFDTQNGTHIKIMIPKDHN